MTKYIVGYEQQTLWEGYANTGIDALREAREKYPQLDRELFWVETAE